jgi:hypothetical protein
MTTLLRIQAPECVLEIECGAEVCAELNRHLFPTHARRGQVSPSIRYEIRQTGSNLELFERDRCIATASSVSELIPRLHAVLDSAVVQALQSMSAVHAGVVALNGRAAVLPGASHRGKSTLVAELLKHGCRHLSDEYALIDDEGLVHPYPRALLLRDETGNQTPVTAADLGAETACEPVAPAVILGLVYDPGAAWRIRAIEQSAMVLFLLQNTPHEVAASAAVVARFARAAGRAACYAGERGEAPEAAMRIVELLA